MDKTDAIAHIDQACKTIAWELKKIQPAVPALGNPEVQDRILRAAQDVSKQIEEIKKRLVQLDDSRSPRAK